MERLRLPEDYDSIIGRVSTRLAVDYDTSLFLLLTKNWDEERLGSQFKESFEYTLLSDYLVNQPQFDRKMVACHICSVISKCQNLGCSHYCCTRCFKERIESEVVKGLHTVFCPAANCQKIIPHSLIKHSLCDEAYQINKNLLTASFRSSVSHSKRFMNFAKGVITRTLRGTEDAISEQLWEHRRDIMMCVVRYVIDKF